MFFSDMEDKSAITTDIITAIVPSAAIENDNNKPPPLVNADEKNIKKNRKSKSSFNFIKAALLLMRRRSNSKSKSITDGGVPNGMLTKIVGSMRPLHLQDNQSPRRSTPTMPSPTVENYDDLFPSSPFSPSASSSADGMSRYASVDNLQELEKGRESRYASAMNLQELDVTDDDDDDDESDDGIDENGGDEMIDSKAEEFIAHFYHQMRLQGVNRPTIRRG